MRYLVIAVVACHGGASLHPIPGSDKDDGHGELAAASARLLTSDQGSGADPLAPRRRKRVDDEYGGSEYASYTVPTWTTPPPGAHRTYPRHAQTAGLTGAIEGTISWRGALPTKRTTACGPVDLAHIAADRGVPDTVIYIEQVKTGRMSPTDGRTATVGGTLVKRGCELLPTTQIVTPLPAALTVHGDTASVKLRVIVPTATPPRSYELQEAGRFGFSVLPGVTRIEADDGGIAAAWVLGLDAPYFAVTDDHGRFRIDELAAGTYDVTIWHAPLANSSAGPLSYGAPIVEHRNVTVSATKPARLDTTIGR